MSTTSGADHRQKAALEFKAAINAAADFKTALNLACDRNELVSCWYFARHLARFPGRIDHDHQQVPMILANLNDWYNRGDFARDEALVWYAKSDHGASSERESDAPQESEHRREGRLVSVQEFKELEPCETVDWRGVLLVRASCERYVYRSSLSGAISLRQEWFADDAHAAAAITKVAASSPRIEEPNHVVARLATWIFEKHSQPPLSYRDLREGAFRNVDQFGQFKVSDFRTAFRRVYSTAKNRPPKTGWPLREPYKSEWAEKKKKSF